MDENKQQNDICEMIMQNIGLFRYMGTVENKIGNSRKHYILFANDGQELHMYKVSDEFIFSLEEINYIDKSVEANKDTFETYIIQHENGKVSLIFEENEKQECMIQAENLDMMIKKIHNREIYATEQKYKAALRLGVVIRNIEALLEEYQKNINSLNDLPTKDKISETMEYLKWESEQLETENREARKKLEQTNNTASELEQETFAKKKAIAEELYSAIFIRDQRSYEQRELKEKQKIADNRLCEAEKEAARY